MMGLGPMDGRAVGGNSSSSVSILSALAPPFTVDRLNPNLNSNPICHYSSSPYSVQPYFDLWQYPLPSASGPELFIDSIGVNSIPLSDAPRFSAAASTSSSGTNWSATSPGDNSSGCAFAYGGEVEPCYPSYVPSVVGEVSMLVENQVSRDNMVPTRGLSSKSQLDCTQSSIDWEYEPQWMDSLGYDCGKRMKMVELDGSFLSDKTYVGLSPYNNRWNHDRVCSIENRSKYGEESGFLYQKFNLDSLREFHEGSLSAGSMKDKSCLGQSSSLCSYDANKTCVLASSSTHPPESHSSILECKVPNNFSSYPGLYSPYDPYDKSTDTLFTGVRRPSSTVIIRSPPVTDVNSGQSLASCKPVHNHGDGFLHNVNYFNSNPPNEKDSSLKLSSKIKEDSHETNLLDFSKQGDGKISLSLMNELSSSLHSKDMSNPKVKATFASQLPDVNASGSVVGACDNAQVVNFTEVPSDSLDPLNRVVDSPCWKGALSSKISPFDLEAGNCKYVKKKMDEYSGSGHEGLQNLPSAFDSGRLFPEKTSEGSKNHQSACTRNGGVLMLEWGVESVFSNKKQNALDDPVARDWILNTTCNGVEIDHDPAPLRKDSGLLNCLTGGFCSKGYDAKCTIDEEGTGMTPNDVSESGVVAVLVAEKVLASPASQEDVVHCPKPDLKLNMKSVIKAMDNLSELLLFHLSNEGCSLEEEYSESLKHTIRNLESCLSKRIFREAKKPRPLPVGSTSEMLEDHSSEVGTISGSSCTVHKPLSSRIKPDSQPVHQRDSCSFSGKKDEKSPIFSSFKDDLDISANDSMVKAMKKVLEENFLFEEEMNSQALLFKSLWLEAEAKLSSISYKARFDRMKIQMETPNPKEQEHEDLAGMMSKVCVSHAMITASKVAPEAHDGTVPEPTLKHFCNSSMTDLDDDIMARWSILKSRTENLKPKNEDQEQEPETVDDEVMARFNILKSGENSLKLINVGEEEKPEFAGEKNALPLCIRDQPESEGQKPIFQCQTDILCRGRFGSFADGAGYESPDEFYLSVAGDPVLHPSNNGTVINQDTAGWHDSLTSDWEHVLEDDF